MTVIDEAHVLDDIISATTGVEIGPGRFSHLGRVMRGILAEAGDTITGVGVHAGLWTSEAMTAQVEDVPVLRRLLAEPAGSLIQGYDEAAWARCHALGYEELPVENSLRVIAAVRAASSLAGAWRRGVVWV